MFTKENEIYFCKRLKLLEWLNRKGFAPFGTMPDKSNPQMTVWLFHNSPALYNTVEDYYANIPIQKNN